MFDSNCKHQEFVTTKEQIEKDVENFEGLDVMQIKQALGCLMYSDVLLHPGDQDLPTVLKSVRKHLETSLGFNVISLPKTLQEKVREASASCVDESPERGEKRKADKIHKEGKKTKKDKKEQKEKEKEKKDLAGGRGGRGRGRGKASTG